MSPIPYIPQERRQALVPPQYAGSPPARMTGPGDLAYVLAEAIARYLRQRGTSWQTINDVLGALDGVARDFWDEVGGPYEAAKREANGRIY